MKQQTAIVDITLAPGVQFAANVKVKQRGSTW